MLLDKSNCGDADFYEDRDGRGYVVNVFAHFGREVMKVSLDGRVAELGLVFAEARGPILLHEGVSPWKQNNEIPTYLKISFEFHDRRVNGFI